MIAEHFTETLNKMELRINHVWINRARPVQQSYLHFHVQAQILLSTKA